MKVFNSTNIARLFALLVFVSYWLVSCKEEYDHTVDVANPVVISFNPVPGVEEISVNSNLVLTFDERVKKGTGNIVITGESSAVTIDVTSDAVVIGEDARIMTITPGELESDEQYSVTLDRGVVTDLLGNEFMGNTGSTPWTFTTTGDSGPLVLTYTPEQAGTEGSLFKLELNFVTNVRKGTGNIAVYSADNNAKVAEFPVTSSAVEVTNRKVVILLGTPLAFATNYYVTVDKGAFEDTNGKKFKGLSGSDGWNFTTTSGNTDNLVVHLPLDDDLTDASGNKFDAAKGSTATADVAFVNDPIRGKVASFGAGSYAVLPKHDLLRPSLTQDFSFNLWVKVAGIGSDPAIFSNSNWDSGGNPGIVLCLDGALTYQGPGTPGRGWILKMTGGGGRMDWRAGQMVPQAPALADNQWHMVTVVIKQTTKRLHVYIDGEEFMQPDNALSYDLNTLAGALWDATNDYPFTIWEDGTGSYNAGSDTRKALAGLLDELRVYNRVLTEEEIAELYQN